jgi:sec-independent protein translocase protein TatB
MFFGLTIEKLLLIGVIAAFIVGPERLPRYAEALAGFTRRARDWVTSARTRVRDEMGEDFDDVDWKTLDPRQYDPRRIIREALLDDAPVPAVRAAQAGAAIAATGTPATPPVRSPFRGPEDGPTPFDSEAT